MGAVIPGAGPVPRRQRLQLAAEIYMSYVRVRWLLRRGDARSAMGKLRRRRPPAAVDEETAALAAGRLAWAVVRALEPLPADSRCLFRSLTLTSLLERRGIDSELIVAVRPAPFEAHAWVERDDVPLLPPATPGFERIVHL